MPTALLHRLVPLCLALLGLLPAAASAQFLTQDPVTVSHQWSDPQARAGDQRVLAIVIDMADTWHINPDRARTDQDLIPTSIDVRSNDDRLQVGPVQYPQPVEVAVNYGTPTTLRAYEHRAILYLPVIVSDDASLDGGPAALSVTVRYQACDDRVCLPPRTATIEAPLEIVAPGAPVGAAAGASSDDAEDMFADFDRSIFPAMLQGTVGDTPGPVRFDVFGYVFTIDASGYGGWALLLLVAAVGGMLLNFTPCVLPVIPIKIMGLSHAAGNRGRCLALGAAMSAGVVAFWMAIGGAIAFVAGFDAINELFQKVWFTVGVGVVIAIMAVAMCGLFTIQLPRSIYAISPRHDTLPGSVGFGVMTAVLSTPCTAPLMGAAAAWAVTQSPVTTLTTFAAIGVGMALPYLFLSAFPQLAARMPRTGPASELVKQVMGLLMLAAAAYFIGVGLSVALNVPPDPPSQTYWWAVAFFITLAGGWLAWRTVRITRRPVLRGAFVCLGTLAIVTAGFGAARLTGPGPIDWIYFTPDRFTRELEQGNIIVLDFTAEWCLNCKTLEHSVLYSDRVVALFEDPAVVPMKVDITSAANVAGAAKLAEVGRVAIPLLVVYAPDGREVFKSDYYTIEQVVAAVREAQGSEQAVSVSASIH